MGYGGNTLGSLRPLPVVELQRAVVPQVQKGRERVERPSGCWPAQRHVRNQVLLEPTVKSQARTLNSELKAPMNA